MILVKQLRELLTKYPDDAAVNAYEGEGVGLVIRHNSQWAFISATESHEVDQQDEKELTLRGPA